MMNKNNYHLQSFFLSSSYVSQFFNINQADTEDFKYVQTTA